MILLLSHHISSQVYGCSCFVKSVKFSQSQGTSECGTKCKKNYQRCTFGLPSLFFPFLFFFPSPVLEIYLKHATMHSTNPLRHFYSFCCYFCILVLQLPCNDTFPFLREFSFLFAPQLMLVIPSLRKKLQVVLAL